MAMLVVCRSGSNLNKGGLSCSSVSDTRLHCPYSVLLFNSTRYLKVVVVLPLTVTKERLL